jgi:hypothetical protein
MTLKIKNIPCQSIRIEHPESSYGIFCFNEAGDLFLSSDWGFYGYSWRSFGDNFAEFLADIGEDYVITKFENTAYNMGIKKGISNVHKKHLTNLISEFKKALVK